MPSWRLFYGGMKSHVELSFLALLELFSIVTGALIWLSHSACVSDAFRHWRFTE